MRIKDYIFGRIIIDGKTYTSDVIIYPDSVDSAWWRKEGHYLQMDDLAAALAEKPDAIVIGTGFNGVMKVADEVVRKLTSKGIEFHIMKTGEAVPLFNDLSVRKKTIACLHLTC